MNGPGFYGKLASRGDFVRCGLPASFVEPWDAWLGAGLAASRTALGPAWLEAYLVSPPWRFVIAPGLLGAAPVAGVMMPSVDRVGRHFPLTAALTLPADTHLGALVGCAEPWFAHVETLLLSTLRPDADPEAFAAALQRLGMPLCQPRLPACRGPLGQWRFAVASAEGRGWALAQLAGEGGSCWWEADGGQGGGSLLCYPGLPAAQSFTDFLRVPFAEARP